MRRMLRGFASLVLVLPLLAGGSAQAAAAPDPQGARAALGEVRELFGAGRQPGGLSAKLGGDRARDLTLALRDLFLLRDALGGAERREADAYFARPTDGAADPFGTGYDVPASQVQTTQTTHFRIHYVTTTADAATPGYAAEVGTVFEEMWTREVDVLGWSSPAGDGSLGGDGRTDVYLVDLSDLGAYGYAAPDTDNVCGPPACGQFHGFMTMDNDYVGYPPDPGGALRATTAHEFNHLLQFAMAYTAESWFFESSATWMETQTYPDVDARTFYVQSFAALPELPITDFATETGGNDRAYGLYVWNLWLSGQFGPEVIRDAWVEAGNYDNHALDGYDAALAARGSSFPEQFALFAAATAEWNTDIFPPEPIGLVFDEVARVGGLSSGDTGSGSVDHTGYALFDVAPEAQITFSANSLGDFEGAVALVAATGSTAELVIDTTLLDGSATVTLNGAEGADRVTAVLVNSDFLLAQPRDPEQREDPVYVADGVPVSFGLNAEPGPVGVGPGPGPGPGPGELLTELVDGGRLDGGGANDPIGQAIATSQALFADGEAQRVVLATADRFPDALAGAALAGDRGPILYTSGLGALDAGTQAEIARVSGGDAPVLILGGTAAVSEQAGNEAIAAGGGAACAPPLPVDCRFAGTGREQTAALIAQTVWNENPAAPDLAFVARGDVFADAITGGAFAAEVGAPILLTPPDQANDDTVAFLLAQDVAQTIVLGGTAAVDDATANALPNFVGRVAGAERTATSAFVNQDLWGLLDGPLGGAILVNVRDDQGWQTALSAAVASAIFAAPQLGVEAGGAPIGLEVGESISQSVSGPLMAFGDDSLVSDSQVADAIRYRP